MTERRKSVTYVRIRCKCMHTYYLLPQPGSRWSLVGPHTATVPSLSKKRQLATKCRNYSSSALLPLGKSASIPCNKKLQSVTKKNNKKTWSKQRNNDCLSIALSIDIHPTPSIITFHLYYNIIHNIKIIIHNIMYKIKFLCISGRLTEQQLCFVYDMTVVL